MTRSQFEMNRAKTTETSQSEEMALKGGDWNGKSEATETENSLVVLCLCS